MTASPEGVKRWLPDDGGMQRLYDRKYQPLDREYDSNWPATGYVRGDDYDLLAAENARLREALQCIAQPLSLDPVTCVGIMQSNARAALAEKP